MHTTISELLREEQVELNLSATTHSEALREIVSLLKKNPQVTDAEAFYEAMIERERQKSTAVGNGIAFPHARTDSVQSIVLAAGRSAAGIAFANTQERVHLIFVIGTPKSLVTEYLVCVGALARFVQNPDTRARLLAAETPAEFLKCLI